MAITLRRARPADAHDIWAVRTAAIERTCAAAYSPEDIARWSAAPRPENFGDVVGAMFIVAEEDGAIVGVGALDLKNTEVASMFVHPDFHRRGIGQTLIAELERRARKAGLKHLVLFSTLNAVPFYEAVGYVARERTVWDHPAGFQMASVKMEKPLG